MVSTAPAGALIRLRFMIETPCALTASESFLQKRDQRRVRLFRGLEVRYVADAWKEMQPAAAVWNAFGDKLHPLLEHGRRPRQAVFGAAKHQRRSFDVLPVVDHGIEILNL